MSVGNDIKVLDHGYVRLIDTWGSDEGIVASARMSTDGAFRGWGPRHSPVCFDQMKKGHDCSCAFNTPGDEKLLRTLWELRHDSPFEQAGMTLEVQAPIFVFREWHRHRTQSYNELSARYTQLPDVNYMPTVERCLLNSQTNKQAGRIPGAAELTEESAEVWLAELAVAYQYVQQVYDRGLKAGLPKEVARACVPVGRYSRMRASANLRNWLGFLSLRDHHAAQWEIRQYAAVVATLVHAVFPRVYELYVERKIGTLESEVLRKRVKELEAQLAELQYRMSSLEK